MDFMELWQGGPLFAQSEHFKLGTDCVLLADFTNTSGAKNGIDLGCASGAIALLLLAKSDSLRMTGLEIVPDAARLAELNMEKNSLSDRSRIINGDIRDYKQLFRTGEFDLVVANPPYFPVGSGKLAESADKAGARGELTCTLEDICRAAAYLCRTGGTFSIVHKPERLSEAMCTMSALGLEPKRLRLVTHRSGRAPSLVLIEAKRGGKPGLRLEPELLIRNPNGTETDEIKKIYRMT